MTVLDRPRAVLAPVTVRPRGAVPALLALVAGLLRLPFVGTPLAPDEGRYLLVASQWRPGASTYGGYFVDRPPLLIGIFGLADALGGGAALRLIGVVGVVTSVLLAAAIGGRWSALAATVFLSTPLFGTTSVDGELLAVPFVLAGVLLVIRSARAPGTTSARWLAIASGACAGSAVLVKQNMVDALVFSLVVLLFRGIRDGWREAAGRAVCFVAGGGLVLAGALWIASRRGTSAAELWDSLVTFRAQAAAVIEAYSPSSTSERFDLLLLSLAVSGAPLVVVAALLSARRPADGVDVRWAGAAMVAWELAGAALGGSYWPHYLIAVVPGLVVLVAAALPAGVERSTGRWARRALGVAAASSAIAVADLCLHPPGPGTDQEVAAYVRTHSSPGDTMVVAFGAPNIVHDAGLTSPYPHLWSLSVRVRDPDLTELVDVLRSADPPRWVVSGTSLATWGVREARGQQVLDQHYREVMSAGDWHVLERR
ncbi:MAG: hypothetical protein QM638_14065 [Nocardioides sp.]|uniref:ArnT family glycosyltransferase n=1 Tax=Nocardioides sp. TaxID=35761 RepID=UPI0039E5E265